METNTHRDNVTHGGHTRADDRSVVLDDRMRKYQTHEVRRQVSEEWSTHLKTRERRVLTHCKVDELLQDIAFRLSV